MASWVQEYRYVHDCALCRRRAPRLQDRFPGFIPMAQDVCYIRDKDASYLADERDHLIRHRQRRGIPPRLWEMDLQKHFWERERIAWLEGESLESRQQSFPKRHAITPEDDSASSNGECEYEDTDSDGEGNGVEDATTNNGFLGDDADVEPSDLVDHGSL